MNNAESDNILVAIHTLAYNHEPYIRQCLEGILMQKTNFRFVVIVHDDVSTDGTANIIREYEKKYPDIIKPIYETENQFSKPDGSLGRIMNEAIRLTGCKYIAMCEGDDYWTDPLKLQKQVDFLESHPEIVYSCHRYQCLDEISNRFYLYPNKYFDSNGGDDYFLFDLEYAFLCEWITKTPTCLYRRNVLDGVDLQKYKYYRDVHLVYYILQKGKGVCHSFVGVVYRKNAGGIYGSLATKEQDLTNYKVYSEFYKVRRDFLLKKLARGFYLNLLVNHHYLIVPKNLFEYETLFCYIPYRVIRKVARKLFEKFLIL